MMTLIALPMLFAGNLPGGAPAPRISDASPLVDKARYLQQDVTAKHLLEGLYVSIVPMAPAGTRLHHTVDQPGNVIHAGVWTGRYLAGVGYQYAVTRDPKVRRHAWEILRGLRKLQEVTGKPGLLARGFVRGHGPVEGWERGGADSPEWHQGQGAFADYRWYGDVSVDNFNAVLYGYAVYHDLAATPDQKRFIAQDVDRLMSHLLENRCRIVDVDGEVTQWGHVGMDPDPARDDYYRQQYARYRSRLGSTDGGWKPPLRASLMLLPDLMIAHHITGKQSYLDFYRRVVERFRANPDPLRDTRPFSLARVARVNHSSEGQSYEALYNLVRYEKDPGLLELYRSWVRELWDMNWMEGNSLFAYITASALAVAARTDGAGRAGVPHLTEGLRLAEETLRLYPIDRVLRPVMNSLRSDIERNPDVERGGQAQAAKPLPINERPLDNEYAWKGNPYLLDGWLKPNVVALASACDDPLVAWFADSAGQVYRTLDGWKTWTDVSSGLMGARIRDLAASGKRTFVLWAQGDTGTFVTRDGGLSWRLAQPGEAPAFTSNRAPLPTRLDGWRVPVASYAFQTARGVVAGGPGGCYVSTDGARWQELMLWPESETGAADYVHAYWMGRYYGWLR